MLNSRRDRRRKRRAEGAARVYRFMALIFVLGGLAILGFSGYEYLLAQRSQEQLREQVEVTAGFHRLVEEMSVVEITEFEPMRLVIPSINLDTIVLGDVEVYDPAVVGNEPWNFAIEDYNRWLNGLKPLMNKGPVFYQLSDLPSNLHGNVVIAAHRTGPANFFRYLDEVEDGDPIYLEVGGYRFIYHLERQEVVDGHDWDMLMTTDEPMITLQTCTPLGVVNPPTRLNLRGLFSEVTPITADMPDAN